jgi:hypothetical protein
MPKRVILLALSAVILVGAIVLLAARNHTTAPVHQTDAPNPTSEVLAGSNVTPDLTSTTEKHEAPGVIVVQKPMGAPLPQGYKHSVDAVKKKDTSTAPRILQGIDQLIDAINKEDVAAVKAAVGKGASVNARDADGHTPLTTAAYVGNEEIVEYLLAQKADVNALNGSGETALFEAIKNADEDGAVAVCKILLAHGAAVNVKCNGVAPLELAIGNQSKQIEALLKGAGAQ